MSNERDQTIQDFGRQWTSFTGNVGYRVSGELFDDLIEPLVSASEFEGCSVADIGSGTGRIVRMLHRAGARRIVAVEPSEAMSELRKDTSDIASAIEYLEARGDQLPPTGDLDWVVSFGVLHHIPDPGPVVAAAYHALRPGGRILVWLYGREGNEFYLSIAEPLRKLTCRLPHGVLHVLSRLLEPFLSGYTAACRWLPLPMAAYMRGQIALFSREARVLTIYDQLNPRYARYYRQEEAIALLDSAGFRNTTSFHRHGYSWTVVATKPG